MLELSDFFVENFKTFKGEHWFSFKDLNIFTGPNNSGKSSLIKAIQLFSEGLRNSDFPLLDLNSGSENHGGFHQVVNKDCNARKFGIGFKVNIQNLNEPFKVIYHFQNGTPSSDNIGLASFLSLEIINSEGEVFIGIYDHYNFWGDSNKSPLKSPFTDSDATSLLNGKININLLKKYAGVISKDFDSSEIIDYLSNKFGEEWWFEVFIEFERFENSIFTKRFNDLLQELANDYYMNLASYDLKEDIYFMTGDKTNELRNYRFLLQRTAYRDFISEILAPIFNSIGQKLTIFRINKASQIKSSDFLKARIILQGKETAFLFDVFKLQQSFDLDNFIGFSSDLFDIKGFPRIEFIENESFTIKLHKFSIRKRENDVESGTSKFNVFIGPEYEIGEPLSSIADYGKGTISLMTLILKTASIIFHEYINDREFDETKQNFRSQSDAFKRIVLIEEPEAFLHPAWQSKLADFFVYCIKKYDVQFYIETHSEYLIRRFQYLTALEKINTEDSVIYYFNTTPQIQKGECQVKVLKIREDGMMDDDFGPGFFDESIRLTVDLLKIQNRN